MTLHTQKQYIDTLVYALSLKDPYTSEHSIDVSTMATCLGKHLGLPHHTIDCISMAAKVHDIGKIGIPLETLIKPTKLSNEEYAVIKTHSQIGYNILSRLQWHYPIPEIVIQHHERIDGSGYPYGLKHNDIRLESKVIAVADVTHALISHRPYRAAKDADYTINILNEQKGIKLDKDICDTAIQCLINRHIG